MAGMVPNLAVEVHLANIQPVGDDWMTRRSFKAEELAQMEADWADAALAPASKILQAAGITPIAHTRQGDVAQTIFVCEPHRAVCCDRRVEGLNLVARESGQSRETITEISKVEPDRIMNEVKKVNQLFLPKAHPVPGEQIRLERLEKVFIKIHKQTPVNFEELLGVPGVGPKTLRALSLISELIYGAKPSFKDPTRFSFAHGGKDGHPYPVDRRVYDQTIEVLGGAVERARIGDRDKMEAVRRLRQFARVEQPWV